MTDSVNARLRNSRVIALIAAAIVLVGCEAGDDAADAELRPLPYAVEYPAIGYATGEAAGRLGRFVRELSRNNADFAFDADRGYLDEVLDALAIEASSQVLVFSRTSLQTRQIHPSTPRAIYFNDDTYVAWAKGAPTFEIAGFDPTLGPVFYSFTNTAGEAAQAERELVTCLRCHDTYGLSGGGVPRFLLGSG
jgi:hypothetical protein